MPTPARRQYLEIKAHYLDALLAYNIGDFYEFFDQDAETAARELHLTLTARSFGPDEVVPLAGVPMHAIEVYASRLVSRGYRVAICDQVSPPGRGLVQRAVTRVLTPGTVVEPGMLAPARDTYLAAVAFGRRDAKTGAPRAVGLAWADASVGAFACVQWAADDLPHALQAELARLAPAEVLISAALAPDDAPEAAWLRPYSLSPCPEDAFEPESARIRLCRHFGVATLAGYGCEHLPLATAAAAAIVHYIERVNAPLLALISDLRTYDTRGFVEMDGRVWQALEVVEPGRATGGAGQAPGATLLATLDATRTPMGARLLRRTLLQPLRDRATLEARLDALGELVERVSLRQRLGALLDGLGDLERLAARVAQGAAVPRELFALASGLGRAPDIRDALAGSDTAALREACDTLDPCDDVRQSILRAVADPTEATGRRLRPGYSPELDTMVAGASETLQWIAALEGGERERTGIRSLKVGYNKVFGYYIEVTRPNLARVPTDYQRRQTIATGERFVTVELKEREAQALHAEERIATLESDLYAALLAELGKAHPRLRRTIGALAQVDVWLALAEVAVARRYTRPELADDTALDIVGGRHPTIEASLDGVEFIPNDTRLDDLSADAPTRAMLLTGPNMAGKSTYLRQVALITLMAQVGSFVPARRARIGLVDRIFARVGAEDDLARGLSTFMLEMVETAFILRHATERSLVVLDEVGRGTSSADGLAIAQAVIERLCAVTGARTLFATHYHELARLAESLPRLAAFRMDVAEHDGQAVFLRRVVPGASMNSYGVHVARMAGLPAEVTARAESLLHHQTPHALVAEQSAAYLDSTSNVVQARDDTALTRTEADRELALALASVNLVAVTPLEALNLLFSLQQRAFASLGVSSASHDAGK